MFKGIASRALGVFALFTIVCGLGYTLVVTGVAQLAFPYQANGSLITVDGKVVGSELIGQNFDDEAHMWGRIQNVSIVEGEDGEVREIIAQCTKGRFLGVFGEPTVNVLKVNLMLDGAL